MRALIIEDDPLIGPGIKRGLSNMGLTADWIKDGQGGLEAMATTNYDVVLLDLGLHGLSGLDVLTAMRAASNLTPVLIVTARDAVESRIAGLDLGADDYIVKPFDIAELGARIRAVVRRRAGHAQAVIDHGELSLDLTKHMVSFNGTSLVLSAREFALVRALAERPGVILSRNQLEEKLYGWGDEVESNAVDVLIYSVRRKFGKEIIRNVRGVGWTVGTSQS